MSLGSLLCQQKKSISTNNTTATCLYSSVFTTYKKYQSLNLKLTNSYKIINAKNKLARICPINGTDITSFLPYLSLNEFAINPAKLAGRNIITSIIIENLQINLASKLLVVFQRH